MISLWDKKVRITLTKDGLEIKDDYLSQTHPFAEWLDVLSSNKNKSKKKGSNNLKKNNLIDDFIESNPRITPKNEKETEVKDFAEESTKEKPDFFTETLAQIYIKQKAYDKAISAYEKLSLKYPEKSIYFADQIEKIKKIIE